MDTSKSYLEETYESLHQIPELGFQEEKTSAFIAEELKRMGYETLCGVGGTGVIGILESAEKGPVLALRSDMDALQFQNEKGEYQTHACGHDANAAMVLTAAKKAMEEGLRRGKLYVLFQPAEEQVEGATRVIKSGHLQEVEEMVGIHLRPIQEAALGQATPALFHGSITRMDIAIKGLNAHGARPHLGINAVDAAVLLINSLYMIRANPSIPHSLKVTCLHAGGDSFNIIPDQAKLVIDIRAQTNELMKDLIGSVKRSVEHTVSSIGAQAAIDFIDTVPAADYDDEMIAIAKEAIEEELGEALAPIVTPGSEDFHFFREKLGIKTTYIGLGADLTPGLHHPEMKFNKKALLYGANILYRFVQKRLCER